MESFIIIFLFGLALAIALNLLFRHFDMPVLIGYIATGVIIINLLPLGDQHRPIMNLAAEFGIVFLMFTIGLEFSFNHLKHYKKQVLLYGPLQVCLSAAVFALIAHYSFALSIKTAVIIGSGLALSSTAVVLKFLNDRGLLAKDFGKPVLGILIFQDLMVIFILIMVAMFSQPQTNVLGIMLVTLIKALSIILVLFLLGKFIITRFLAIVNDLRSQELFVAAVLLLVIGSAFLTHVSGFSYSLGAFLGGMMISECRFRYQVEADLEPFRDLLLGVFFVSVGMQINIHFLAANFMEIFTVMFAIMLFKGIILFAIMVFFENKSIALQSALILSQTGEFSFVVLELARSKALISSQNSQLLIVAIVFSMVLTPTIIKKSITIRERLTKLDLSSKTIPRQAHFVLIGYGYLGESIARQLQEFEIPFVVIEDRRKLIDIGNRNGHPMFFGNVSRRSILNHVRLDQAAAVIIAINDSQKIRTVVEYINNYAPHANVVVRISTQNDKNTLGDLKIAKYIVQSEETAKSMVRSAMICNLDQERKKA